MKNSLKKILKSNPLMHKVARKIQNLTLKFRKPISGSNNRILNYGIIQNVKYDIVGDNNRIEISEGAFLSNLLIFIRGNNHYIKIGKGCHYRGGSLWLEDHHGLIDIGANTTVESADIAVTEPYRKIILGENCMLAYAIEFRTGDSHSIIDKTSKERLNPAKDISVGNHVWIGAHSIILKGVNIADNSIVGTNSLVTRDVPQNSIVAGIPAKVVKSDIDWLRERV